MIGNRKNTIMRIKKAHNVMTKISKYQEGLRLMLNKPAPKNTKRRLQWWMTCLRIEESIKVWDRRKQAVWASALPREDFFCDQTGEHTPLLKLIQEAHLLR